MTKLAVFLLLTLSVSVYSQCTIDSAQSYYKRSIYDFTLKLAERININGDGQFVASGLSAWNLLATISLGASDVTLREIGAVLRLHPHKCFQDNYNKIARQITIFTNSTVLERSAIVLVDENLDVTSMFIHEVEKAGISELKFIDFSNPYVTSSYVNDYVSQSTHEAIGDIVTSSDIEGASVLMLDALYFKGFWKTQFPYAETEQSAFYDHRGNQIGDVNLMYVSGTFNITYVRQLEAEVLEMPYGEEDRFSMLVFLPKKGKNIANLIEDLNSISLRTIFALFARHSAENVVVQLPKFKVSSDINNLKELLMDMGLRQMFNRHAANFDALVHGRGLYVSNIIQKAEIEVTEEGTVASAATEAEFEGRMLPRSFYANRPFVFMIVDKFVEIPIFIGAYSTPSVF